MAYKRKSIMPVVEGGTDNNAYTAYSIICGGTTSTGPLQNVTGVGNTYNVLISNGAATLPSWGTLDVETFFEPLASDPSSPSVGQVWYNTTSNEYKGYIAGGPGVGWVVKASLAAPKQTMGAAGVDGGDALEFGGDLYSASKTSTSRYNGIADTWTVKGSLNTARSFPGGAGDADSALAFGGLKQVPSSPGVFLKSTELYASGPNTWTTKNNLSTAKQGIGGNGTSSDALCVGGTIANSTERWDGTNWSTKANLSNAINLLRTSGDANTTLKYGGTVVPYTLCEYYDGTANTWSSRSSLNSGRYEHGGAGNSTSSGAMAYGGTTTGTTFFSSTNQYDGVANSWSVIENLNLGVKANGGAGTNNDALSIGGEYSIYGARVTAATERYEGSTSDQVIIFTVV